MPNSYWLMSALGLMMDVTGGVAAPGTSVEVWTVNSPPSPNQLWTLEPGPYPGYFYIKSNLGPNLVLDITGGVAVPGTHLQVWTQNSPSTSANQLWQFVSLLGPDFPIGQGHIQSLFPGLVVDVTGGSSAPRGTRLEVWTQNLPPSANQLWSLIPAPTTISLSIGREEFTVTGSGWVAGTTVQVTSYFSFAGGPDISGSNGVTVAADGTFRDTIQVNYFGTAGRLFVQATDSNSGQSASANAPILGG
jgi:hypothetical protein